MLQFAIQRKRDHIQSHFVIMGTEDAFVQIVKMFIRTHQTSDKMT